MLAEVPKWLMDILACPVCKGDVFLEEDKIICGKCRKKYPVNRRSDHDVPVMLIDKAKDF